MNADGKALQSKRNVIVPDFVNYLDFIILCIIYFSYVMQMQRLQNVSPIERRFWMN